MRIAFPCDPSIVVLMTADRNKKSGIRKSRLFCLFVPRRLFYSPLVQSCSLRADPGGALSLMRDTLSFNLICSLPVKPQSEEEIRSRLAAHILRGRKRKAWTQQTLAERSELPRSYIADLEGARRNPSIRSLLRISGALGVQIHELFLEPPGR